MLLIIIIYYAVTLISIGLGLSTTKQFSESQNRSLNDSSTLIRVLRNDMGFNFIIISLYLSSVMVSYGICS